jgi:hypothetical protein
MALQRAEVFSVLELERVVDHLNGLSIVS